MTVHERTVNKALRRGNLSDVFTSSLYAASPYRGCGHACLYCDGRAEKYFVEGDFATDLEVRVNLPELLARELDSERERGADGQRCMLGLGSGVTDVYQPLERERELTRRCAEVLAERDFPVLIMTKSALVRRDLDLWQRVARRSGCVLLMSVASVDEEVRRLFEPGASPLAERLETLRLFREAGCITGMLAMPLLPGISDDSASVRRLYERALEVGVDYLMPGGLTLRPGRQKDLYLGAITREHPDLLALYAEIYGEQRPSGNSTFAFRQRHQPRIDAVRRAHSLPYLLPHRLLRQILPEYEALHLLLGHMQELYAERGVPTAPLVRSAARYSAWLAERRRTFRRRRSLPDGWIGEELRSTLATGELEQLLDNARLAAFVRGVLTEGVTLDYCTLERQSV